MINKIYIHHKTSTNQQLKENNKNISKKIAKIFGEIRKKS